MAPIDPVTLLGLAGKPFATQVGKKLYRELEKALGKPDLATAIKESDDGFIVDLAQDVRRLRTRVSEKVNALEAYDLALQAVEYAHRAHDEDKRRLLRNVFANALTLPTTEAIRVQVLLRTVADLDLAHLLVLRIVACATPLAGEGARVRYLADAPSDVDPEDYAKSIRGKGGILGGGAIVDTALGRVVTRCVDSKRVTEMAGLDEALVCKLVADLESQGLIERHAESEGVRIYFRLTSFGVHFLVFLRPPPMSNT